MGNKTINKEFFLSLLTDVRLIFNSGPYCYFKEEEWEEKYDEDGEKGNRFILKVSFVINDHEIFARRYESNKKVLDSDGYTLIDGSHQSIKDSLYSDLHIFVLEFVVSYFFSLNNGKPAVIKFNQVEEPIRATPISVNNKKCTIYKSKQGIIIATTHDYL